MARRFNGLRLIALARSDQFKLALLLGLSFFLIYQPHLIYPYPLHVDEWVHLADSQAVSAASGITYVDPLSGSKTITPSADLEIGFHVFLSILQSLTGVSWMTIFSFLPALLFLILVFSAYIYSRRLGLGTEAVLFTALIPTSLGVLGPVFLVPVSLGLIYVPLCLLIVSFDRSKWSLALLFGIGLFLVTMHAPSAIILILILFPGILLRLPREPKFAIGMILALALPFLVGIPWMHNTISVTLRNLVATNSPSWWVAFPQVAPYYGYIPIGLCVIGAAALVRRGGRANIGLLLGLFALLLVLAVFYSFHRGVDLIYNRGVVFSMAMIGLVAGVGLTALGRLNFSPERGGLLREAPRYAGVGLALALIVGALVTLVPARINTEYYYLIDSEDYRAFTWIAEFVPASSGRGILDPWKATAFAALAQRPVYARLHSGITRETQKADEFLRNGCSDTAFLAKNGVYVVYSPDAVSNPDLLELRKDVYVLAK